LERRFGLGPSLGRLRWRPLSPIHPAHQDLHLRECLLLRPPFPLATELDEVFVGPDLKANPERPATAGLLDPQPPGARAGHQLARSGAIRLGGPTRESSPRQQPHAIGEHGGRCRRRLTCRRRREKAIDLREVEAQPASDAQGSEAVGIPVDPATAHAEVARHLYDADELGAIRRVVDELDEPLSDRLDVFAVERHLYQAAGGAYAARNSRGGSQRIRLPG
jgi:hypothetical protein